MNELCKTMIEIQKANKMLSFCRSFSTFVLNLLENWGSIEQIYDYDCDLLKDVCVYCVPCADVPQMMIVNFRISILHFRFCSNLFVCRCQRLIYIRFVFSWISLQIAIFTKTCAICSNFVVWMNDACFFVLQSIAKKNYYPILMNLWWKLLRAMILLLHYSHWKWEQARNWSRNRIVSNAKINHWHHLVFGGEQFMQMFMVFTMFLHFEKWNVRHRTKQKINQNLTEKK